MLFSYILLHPDSNTSQFHSRLIHNPLATIYCRIIHLSSLCCLIQLHFVGLSAPALFHLKIIICYGNSDVKLVQVGLGAMNKYKRVHHRGLELLLGLGVAHLCRSALTGPVFWKQQSARRGQVWVTHLEESVHFGFYSFN